MGIDGLFFSRSPKSIRAFSDYVGFPCASSMDFFPSETRRGDRFELLLRLRLTEIGPTAQARLGMIAIIALT